MTRLGPSDVVLVVALSALAGFVDAVGFILLGGYFVSFMSGNSTQLGVDLILRGSSWEPAALIALFVAGVFAGSLLGHAVGRQRAPAVLGLITVLLVAASCFHPATVALLALAMGMENTVLDDTTGQRFGLTYVTGSLVKVGQRAAGAFTGVNGPWEWLPFLLLWAGLVAGAIAGAASYSRWGLSCLWSASLAALILTLVVTFRPLARPEGD